MATVGVKGLTLGFSLTQSAVCAGTTEMVSMHLLTINWLYLYLYHSTFGTRASASSSVGPTVWKSLPDCVIQLCVGYRLEQFWRDLKIHLFVFMLCSQQQTCSSRIGTTYCKWTFIYLLTYNNRRLRQLDSSPNVDLSHLRHLQANSRGHDAANDEQKMRPTRGLAVLTRNALVLPGWS